MYKSIIVIAFMFFSLNATNNIYENNYFNEIIKRSEVLLTSLMDFESRDTEKIVNDRTGASGILQLYKIYIDEVNRILKCDKYNYDDRFNMKKSIEMFYIVQEYWNPEFDIEKGARLHGGGFHVNTDNYYKMYLPFYFKHLKEYSF